MPVPVEPPRPDLRLLFGRGWILIVGLVCFGAAAIGLFVWSAPRGSAGWWRFAAAVAIVLLAGGIVAPLITRALLRRRV